MAALRSLVIVVTIAVSVPAFSFAREWTSKSGAYSVNAELVEVITTEDGHPRAVRLLFSGGSTKEVPLSALSDADVKHVKDFLKQKQQTDLQEKNLELIETNQPIWSLFAFSANEVLLAFKNRGTPVGRLDLTITTGRIHDFLRGHEAAVRCVTHSPDKKKLLTGDFAGNITIWDAKSGRNEKTLNAFDKKGVSNQITFNPDGKSFYSGNGHRGEFKCWSWPGLQLKSKTDCFGLRGIWTIACSPDGTHVAVAGSGKVIQVYDVVSGELVHELVNGDSCDQVSFSPDGNELIATSWGKGIKRFDAGRGKEISTMEFGPSYCMALSEDGSRLAVGGYGDMSLAVYDLSSWTRIGEFDGHETRVSGVCFMPGGQRIVAADWKGRIRVRSIEK